MRRPFRSSFNQKVILRRLREYGLPKIKTLRQFYDSDGEIDVLNTRKKFAT